MLTDYENLSKLTGQSYRTLRKRLEEAGVVSVSKKGRKFLFESKEALPVLYGQGLDETKLQLDQERAKLAQQQERKLKRENDIAEGLFAPVSLITEALEKSACQIIPVLESLPLEMKRMNPELTGHDIQLAKKSIARCRNAIADMELEL